MTAQPSATADVLVVGGGPGGSAAATQLARRGHRVVVVERNVFPHGDHSGALLTPRSLAALRQLELHSQMPFHRVRHVRFSCDGRSVTTAWPSHPDFPPHAAAVSRAELNHRLSQAAASEGATVLVGHEATDAIVERGFARGAVVSAPDGTTFEARANFTIVADGANSRFGRALGTSRKPSWPFAIAHRATYRSPLHDVSEVELILGLDDRAGTPITGFAWMLPAGDGTVTVGVMLMSSSPSFQVLNPAHLLEQVIAEHGDRWHLAEHPTAPGASGRVPLGMSVGPSAGPTYLLIGDAVGAGNPLSGAGIEAALETGALAADVVDEALRTESAALQQYTQSLVDRYGAFYQVGRLATRTLGQPALSRRVNRLAARRRPVADAFLRLASNELRPGRAGLAELAYRVGRTVSLVGPET